MDKKWDILLSKFRSLGGIAENVCQKEGALGRGIFSINPNLKSRIFTPSHLMIKKEDIYLEDNHLRIKKNKEYDQEIRDFFSFYQDNFSWGRGGKETTDSFEKGLNIFPSNLKKLIKSSFLVDLEERHKGDWEEILKKQFLFARAFQFGEDSVIVPLIELVNHEVNAFPFLKKLSGISTPNYAPRNSELTHVYGYSGAVNRVLNYGFFCREPIVFSIPFNLNLKSSRINLICKGLNLRDDKITYKSDDSEIIIDGIPIASCHKMSFVKSYFEHILELTNLNHINQDIFSEIIRLNQLRRKEILLELNSINNLSSKIIKEAIDYEVGAISQV